MQQVVVGEVSNFKIEAPGIVQLQLSRLGCLGVDDDNTVRRSRTVDGRGRGVFQYRDVGHSVRIQVVDFFHAHLKSVKDKSRQVGSALILFIEEICVRIGQGVDATHLNVGYVVWVGSHGQVLVQVERGVQRGHRAQHVLVGYRAQFGATVIGNRTRKGLFALCVISCYHHVLQRQLIAPHEDIHLGSSFLPYGCCTYIGYFQESSVGHILQREVPVDVAGYAPTRSVNQNRGSHDRRAVVFQRHLTADHRYDIAVGLPCPHIYLRAIDNVVQGLVSDNPVHGLRNRCLVKVPALMILVNILLGKDNSVVGNLLYALEDSGQALIVVA